MVKVRILWKDNKIACCSQMCDKTCPHFSECRLYMIDIRRYRDRKENLSFTYFEKMMSEGHVYKRGKGGARRQVK